MINNNALTPNKVYIYTRAHFRNNNIKIQMRFKMSRRARDGTTISCAYYTQIHTDKS